MAETSAQPIAITVQPAPTPPPQVHWSAFLTPSIAALAAGIAAWIAWQNVRTARHKIKVDLFDKRYKIYDKLMQLTDSLYGQRSPENDAYVEFIELAKEAQWIYPMDAFVWLDRNLGEAIKEMVLKHGEVEFADTTNVQERRAELRAARSKLVRTQAEFTSEFSRFLNLNTYSQKKAHTTWALLLKKMKFNTRA